MPSTPIHDPITKRVSRYNRSRDPYLTLPYLALGGPTTSLDPLGRYLVDKRVERFARYFSPRYGGSDTLPTFEGRKKLWIVGGSRRVTTRTVIRVGTGDTSKSFDDAIR